MYYTLNPYRSMTGMSRMLNEMNQLFNQGNSTPNTHPKVNAWANDDGLILTMELPGVDPKSIELTVQDDTLTVTGDYPERGGEGDSSYHRNERRHGRFSREVTLPYRVNVNGVQAKARNGVLCLTLPKPEEEKPKKIAVSVG